MPRKATERRASPRKPTLSPTKLTTYLACPVKYRWTYVDSRGKWYLRSKSYYSFGSTLHSVLQRFHDSADQGVKSTEEVMAAYEESWIDAGFSSAEEMAEAFGDGKEILERHVEEVRRRPVSAKTLYVERQLRADLGDFVLLGRLDRVDEHEDGRLEVVDYKTGRMAVTTDEVRSDIAMNCYQLLLSKLFPGRPVVATIIALRSGVSASHSLGSEEMEEFERDLRALGSEILNRDFDEAVPTFKQLCGGCDFVQLCRKHPVYAELGG